MQCPTSNSLTYNQSLCACNPGFLFNTITTTCSPFTVSNAAALIGGTRVDYSVNLPETILSFDSIKKYTQSQDVFLGATLLMIIILLLFCFLVRFGSLGDGRTLWFKIRWWISRLDVCFATRHWLGHSTSDHKRVLHGGSHTSIRRSKWADRVFWFL